MKFLNLTPLTTALFGIAGFMIACTPTDSSENQAIGEGSLINTNSTWCVDELGIELPECTNKIGQPILEGALNFRQITLPDDNDLQLVPNVLFRSDALHELTDNDVKLLQAI